MDLALSSKVLILVIKVFHLNFSLLINLSLLKIKVNPVGLLARYVERMVIQLLIVTIAWILHIKEGMPLLNLLQWWPMLLKFRLPTLGSLTQAAQIM